MPDVIIKKGRKVGFFLLRVVISIIVAFLILLAAEIIQRLITRRDLTVNMVYGEIDDAIGFVLVALGTTWVSQWRWLDKLTVI